jgi:hypothetical protein
MMIDLDGEIENKIVISIPVLCKSNSSSVEDYNLLTLGSGGK